MKVVLIGGAGFLGNHVARRYHDLTIIDHCERDDPVCPRPFNSHSPNVAVSRFETCIDAIMTSGPDLIIHMAATSLRRTLLEGHTQALDENAAGVMLLLDALLREKWNGRLVYVSSSEVYGDAEMPSLGYTEASEKRPVTPYAVAKYAAERNVLYAARHCNLNAVVVRPFNLYGPYAHYEGLDGEVIPRTALLAWSDDDIVTYGDTTRDFLWVEDAARGIALAAERGCSGEDYNLATGWSWKIKWVQERIVGRIGTGSIVAGPARRGDTSDLLGNASKADADLGWRPQTHFREGLPMYLDWLSQQDLKAMRAKVSNV